MSPYPTSPTPILPYLSTLTPPSPLYLSFSEDAKKKLADLVDFVDDVCIPAEAVYHEQISKDPATRWKVIPPVMEELKTKAKKLGLWNLFLSKAHYPE